MKSFKKLIAGTLVFTMMLAVLTSCNTKTPDEIKVRAKDNSDGTEATTVSEPSEPVGISEPVETAEPTETSPAPTGMPEETDDYIPEYNISYLTCYDGNKEQSVRVANINFSGKTLRDFPGLSHAVADFNENNTEDMLFEILDNLPDADGIVYCQQEITVARADNQIFSFSVHYLAYSGNPNDGVIFDYIEAYSYDVPSGNEYSFEDIFNMDMTEDEYVESRTGITGSGDVYYLIGYNGVTVIAEKAGGYDPNDPISTLTYTDYYIDGVDHIFLDPNMFSVEDCVIRNFGWDLDFINNITEESLLETYIKDPYTGKNLHIIVLFTPNDNQDSTTVEMTVKDMDSGLKVAYAEFAANAFSEEAFLFCREGHYSLALQISGYDDEAYVTFLQFTGDNQISDPVIVNGYLRGYAAKFSGSFDASDMDLMATECNSTQFIYFSKRIDLLGTYYYLDRYHFSEDMIPEDLVDIDRALTYFDDWLITAIDFDFRVGDSDDKVTLPAGTEFDIYGVIPSERVVVLQSGDDYYSLKFDDLDDSFQNKVDGIPDTEIFEEVFYQYGL